MPRLPRGIYKRTYNTRRGPVTGYYGSVWDSQNRKLQATKLCENIDDAKVLRLELERKVDIGETLISTKTSVNEFLLLYCEYLRGRISLGKIKQSTYETYKAVLNNTLKKWYGNIEVRKLTPDHFDRLRDDLIIQTSINYTQSSLPIIRKALSIISERVWLKS